MHVLPPRQADRWVCCICGEIDLRWKDVGRAQPFPKEFREDVVWVAPSGDASVAQVAEDVGISESCRHGWPPMDDVEQGKRPGVTTSESVELRELRTGNKLLDRGRAVSAGRAWEWAESGSASIVVLAEDVAVRVSRDAQSASTLMRSQSLVDALPELPFQVPRSMGPPVTGRGTAVRRVPAPATVMPRPIGRAIPRDHGISRRTAPGSGASTGSGSGVTCFSRRSDPFLIDGRYRH